MHGDARMHPMFLEGSILGSLTFDSAIHGDQLLRNLESQGIIISDTRYGFHPYFQQNNLLRLCITRVGIDTIEKEFSKVLEAISLALDKGYEIRRTNEYM